MTSFFLKWSGLLAFIILAILSYFILMVDTTLGLKILWLIIVPVAPIVFFLAPNIWVSLCPFSFLQALPAKLGKGGRKILSPKTNQSLEYIGWILLFFLVPLRHIWFDVYGPVAFIAIIGIAMAALVSGFIFSGLSGWCNSICPVRPVELLYGLHSSLKSRPVHCETCAKCVDNCSRTNKRSWINDKKHVLLSYLFPGFVLAFFLENSDSSILNIYLTTLVLMLASFVLCQFLKNVFKIMDMAPLIAVLSIAIYYIFTIYKIGAYWNLNPFIIAILYFIFLLSVAGAFFFNQQKKAMQVG